MATPDKTSNDTAREFVFAGWRCRYGTRFQGLPTHAQIEVLAGLAAGMTQKEIAKLRGVSPSTIKTAVNTVYYWLGVYRASGAVAEAMRRGWITPLLLAIAISSTSPHQPAQRIRQPIRVRQMTAARLARRDLGSIYA